jgi:hypothetical protein
VLIGAEVDDKRRRLQGELNQKIGDDDRRYDESSVCYVSYWLFKV